MGLASIYLLSNPVVLHIFNDRNNAGKKPVRNRVKKAAFWSLFEALQGQFHAWRANSGSREASKSGPKPSQPAPQEVPDSCTP